jgi:hypothetical protein
MSDSSEIRRRNKSPSEEANNDSEMSHQLRQAAPRVGYKVTCGPLLSRHFAAYMRERSTQVGAPPSPPEPNGTSTTEAGQAIVAKLYDMKLRHRAQMNWKIPMLKSKYAFLENCVPREVVNVGFTDLSQQTDYADNHDDLISARLRMFQKDVLEQSNINGASMVRIAWPLKDQLAYKEYTIMLEDLDKQIEEASAKSSGKRKAKKKMNAPDPAAAAGGRVGIDEKLRILMDQRKWWADTIGQLFDEGVTALPNSSIFDSKGGLLVIEKVGRQGD